MIFKSSEKAVCVNENILSNNYFAFEHNIITSEVLLTQEIILPSIFNQRDKKYIIFL